MPNQSVRQAARRAALDAQIRVRRREEERDKRRSRLGVTVVTALAERDDHVLVCERRAAHALEELIEAEDLTVQQVAEWCDLHVREVRRLLRDLKKSVDIPVAGKVPAESASRVRSTCATVNHDQ